MSKKMTDLNQLRERKRMVRLEIAECEEYFLEHFEAIAEPVEDIVSAFKKDGSPLQSILSHISVGTVFNFVTGIVRGIAVIRGFSSGKKKRRRGHRRNRR